MNHETVEPSAMAARALRPAAVLTALVGLLYLWWLPPDVHYGGDCGEMACSVGCLGVNHPTGYPLYLMLTRLLTLLLPWGTLSWRVAAGSALAAALAVGLVTWAVAVLTEDRVAGVAAGLVLAADTAFASLAVIAVVYPLHNAILAAELACCVQLVRTGDRRWANLLGLGFGLGLMHHATNVLNAPGVALGLLVAARRWGGWRQWPGLLLRVAGFAALVTPLWLYLPLRASLRPPLCWGHCETLTGFLAHIRGGTYGQTLLDITPRMAAGFAGKHLFLITLHQGSAVLCALAGAVWLLRRETALGLVVLGSALANLWFAANYDVGNRLSYMLPVHLDAAVLAGVGVGAGRRWVARRSGTESLAPLLTAVVALLLPVLPGLSGYAPLSLTLDQAPMHGNRFAANQVDAVLAELPPNAAVVSSMDELTNALWYRQLVDARRRDVLVIQRAWLETAKGRAHMETDIRRELGRRRVFLNFWDEPLSRQYTCVIGAATVELVRDAAPAAPELTPATGRSDALPGAPGWELRGARLTSPTRTAEREPVPLVRPRQLGSLTVSLSGAGSATAWDLQVVTVHRALDAELAGRRAAGPQVVNDSTGRVERGWLTRLPLTSPAAQRLPLWAPDRCVPGEYAVRVGLVPHGERPDEDLARAWQRSVAVGRLRVRLR